MNDRSSQTWKVLSDEEVFQQPPWIRVFRQIVRLPNGQVVEDYHRIQLIDFVLIVASTESGQLLVERQYKHGIGRVSLLLPAGGIGEGEEPLVAAQRELLEETGYAAEDWQCVGTLVANANYGCGTAHVFTAHKARPVAPPKSGDLEDLEILLLYPKQVHQAIRSGEIAAMSVVTAFLLAMQSDGDAAVTARPM